MQLHACLQVFFYMPSQLRRINHTPILGVVSAVREGRCHWIWLRTSPVVCSCTPTEPTAQQQIIAVVHTTLHIITRKRMRAPRADESASEDLHALITARWLNAEGGWWNLHLLHLHRCAEGVSTKKIEIESKLYWHCNKSGVVVIIPHFVSLETSFSALFGHQLIFNKWSVMQIKRRFGWRPVYLEDERSKFTLLQIHAFLVNEEKRFVTSVLTWQHTIF